MVIISFVYASEETDSEGCQVQTAGERQSQSEADL